MPPSHLHALVGRLGAERTELREVEAVAEAARRARAAHPLVEGLDLLGDALALPAWEELGEALLHLALVDQPVAVRLHELEEALHAHLGRGKKEGGGGDGRYVGPL